MWTDVACNCVRHMGEKRHVAELMNLPIGVATSASKNPSAWRRITVFRSRSAETLSCTPKGSSSGIEINLSQQSRATHSLRRNTPVMWFEREYLDGDIFPVNPFLSTTKPTILESDISPSAIDESFKNSERKASKCWSATGRRPGTKSTKVLRASITATCSGSGSSRSDLVNRTRLMVDMCEDIFFSLSSEVILSNTWHFRAYLAANLEKGVS